MINDWKWNDLDHWYLSKQEVHYEIGKKVVMILCVHLGGLEVLPLGA
jgi:hypothetical protein